MRGGSRPAALLCAAALVLAPACGGGGGGGGGGPTTPPPPQQAITFTPDGAAEDRSVYLDAADASTPDRLVLEVRIQGADAPGVFGVGFDLVYPAAFMDFDPAAAEAGDFLGGDGVDVDFEAQEDAPGRLLVSVTRLGDTAGGVTGSGLLLTLELPTTASGTGDLAIENALLVDGAGDRRFDYAFIGGSVTVRK